MISLSQHMRPTEVRNVVKRTFREPREGPVGSLQYQIYQIENKIHNGITMPVELEVQRLDRTLQITIWRELGIIR